MKITLLMETLDDGEQDYEDGSLKFLVDCEKLKREVRERRSSWISRVLIF